MRLRRLAGVDRGPWPGHLVRRDLVGRLRVADLQLADVHIAGPETEAVAGEDNVQPGDITICRAGDVADLEAAAAASAWVVSAPDADSWTPLAELPLGVLRPWIVPGREVPVAAEGRGELHVVERPAGLGDGHGVRFIAAHVPLLLRLRTRVSGSAARVEVGGAVGPRDAERPQRRWHGSGAGTRGVRTHGVRARGVCAGGRQHQARHSQRADQDRTMQACDLGYQGFS